MGIVLSLGLLTPTTAFGQSTPPADAAKAEQKAPAKEEPKRDPKAVEYEKAIKDLEKSEGAFTIYQRRKDILLELPEEKLGKLFFIQGTFHHGFSQDPVQAGSPIGGQAVDVYRFERMGDEVVLVRPNLRYRWSKDDPLGVAAARSMPEAYLADLRVEQTNPETKRLLLNANALFSGELNQLNMLVTVLGGAQYSLDRNKSGVERIVQSADVTSVRMNYVFNGRPSMMENPFAALLGGFTNQAEDNRSLPLKVTWTVQWRPEKSDYMPRVADPRVGYFTQDFWNMDRFFKMDRNERFINRWNLKKKDPNAALSEPVKPIVWTIDNSIPARWRPAVRDGILRWNRAFEALGFKNAIQVVDAPANDPNYDHADGRRNVVRFTMTEDAGYAIALFRTDPLTGEILNAGVTIDANFVSFINQEYLLSAVPSVASFQKKLESARAGITQFRADGIQPRHLLLGAEAKRNKIAQDVLRQHGWAGVFCDLGKMHMMDAAFNYRAMQASGLGISAERYIESYLADVVAHEIGHCLGLRHNFVASTNLTTAELGSAACCEEHQIAASVMEYTPTNIVAILNNNINGLHNKSLGAYDMFAIRYGYQDVPGNSPDAERFHLSQIARRGGERGNAFMSDEDADGVDPYVVRFDLAKDPLNYKEKELLAGRNTRRWAINNLPRQGESYAERNMLVLNTLVRQFREAMSATAFVTGVVGNRNFRGDVNEKPTLRPVEPATARQAMQLIANNALSVSAVDVPDHVLNNMSLDYASGEGHGFTAPIRTLISFNQLMVLAQLLNAENMNQVLENQFKMQRNPNAYTLDEHVGLVVSAVFSEIGSNRSIPSLRRELQAFAMESMIGQAAAVGLQSEVKRVADDGVMRVKEQIERQMRSTTGLDSATVSHLRGLQRQIQRYEARQMMVAGG